MKKMTPAVTAWRDMLAYHSEVIFRTERALKEARTIPLAFYDILIELETTPEKRMRLYDLSKACLLTKSGITKIVNTLEKQGYLKRERCPGDKRGFFAVITEKGGIAVRKAWLVYRKCIEDFFAKALNARELAALGVILPKLRRNLPENFMEKACGE